MDKVTTLVDNPLLIKRGEMLQKRKKRQNMKINDVVLLFPMYKGQAVEGEVRMGFKVSLCIYTPLMY